MTRFGDVAKLTPFRAEGLLGRDSKHRMACLFLPWLTIHYPFSQ
jgi:hypothetical protein